jgi:hypothetical protein
VALEALDLASERPASAEVTSWVLALWTERLVGGQADAANDPLAIRVFSELSPRGTYRLCHLLGLCKLFLAGERPLGSDLATNRARVQILLERLPLDAELQAAARRDVKAGRSSRLPARRHLARIGLVTLARLLADAEPFRQRWALQHWPYPIAKVVRSLMGSPGGASSALLAWESRALTTAWASLHFESNSPLDLSDTIAKNGSIQP